MQEVQLGTIGKDGMPDCCEELACGLSLAVD